jgi:limonene-1,2-epoxide hydrolase
MTPKETIESFYTAFQNKDFKTMQSLYADNAIFNDEAFTNLNAAQVKAMWQMLISRGKDLEIKYKILDSNGDKAKVNWVATYTFSATGNKVINDIIANFIIENGKIIKHTDSFNFYNWSKQALGLKGLLFGKMNFFRKKVQATAMGNLTKFMQK